MKKKIILGLLACGCAFSLSNANAGQYADALGVCIYNNMTQSDKDVFTQWAFVTLGKTKAAQQITVIPKAKITAVNNQAKETLQRLIFQSCSSEAAKVALYETKSGMKDTISVLAQKLLEDEVKAHAASSFPNSLLGGNSQTLREGLGALKNLLK